ncbi:MAG TPA: hypothetical protein VFW66_08540, partial [Gemmatimonadales bacterium]|nr:hypothetical protein [Gemmatimonadales bacterium]
FCCARDYSAEPARARDDEPMIWHLWIDDLPRPGFINMGIDSALLDLAELEGDAFLRLYRWSPPCLSFGRHEPAARRYRRERIEALGLDTVRRPTGGRAVWHADELTYAVAAPSGAMGSLAESHRRIHEALARGLRYLGADAALAPVARAAPLGAGACFDSAAGGEVTIAGRKVAGSAQLRTRAAFLQHGSLLLSGDQRVLSAVSARARPLETALRGTESPPPDVTLRDALGRRVSFAEAAEAITDAAREWAPAESWLTLDRGGAIVERAAAFADIFRSAAWTWSR